MADAEKVEKVKKGLECCKKHDCDLCPYDSSECWNDTMFEKLSSDALSVIRELKAENERLRQEKADAVKRIADEQTYESSEMNKCGNDGDDWGYGVHAGKYTAYQFALDIINKLSI